MFRLDGKKTYVIPFSQRHLNDERYYGWLTDYDVIKTINRPDYIIPVPFDDVKRYCEDLMNSKTDIFLALYDKDEESFIGTVKVGSINWFSGTADIGIMIGDKGRWGRGFAQDALNMVCTYLFDVLGMRKLTAGSMAVNKSMITVFQKLGFREEGVFRLQDRFEGGYCDHIYLGCFKTEFVRNK